MKHIKDITGLRYGNLTVIKFTGKTMPGRGAIWLCRCNCGNYREVATNHLNYGQVIKCKNCVKIDRQKRALSISETRNKRDKLRCVWNNMKYRCLNPDCKAYKHYGGRGITICKEWVESYDSFNKWALLNGYKDKMTLERINVNGNYCPENCRFIPMRQQAYNKRNSRKIIFNGKEIPIGYISETLGIDNQTFYICLRRLSKQKLL